MKYTHGVTTMYFMWHWRFAKGLLKSMGRHSLANCKLSLRSFDFGVRKLGWRMAQRSTAKIKSSLAAGTRGWGFTFGPPDLFLPRAAANDVEDGSQRCRGANTRHQQLHRPRKAEEVAGVAGCCCSPARSRPPPHLNQRKRKCS